MTRLLLIWTALLTLTVLTARGQTNTPVSGVYIYQSEDRTSGGTNLKLKIKKDSSFEKHSDSHIGGIYTDYGKWEVKGDTLFLFCQYRKYKFSDKKEHLKIDKYIVKANQLCRISELNTENAEICFAKK